MGVLPGRPLLWMATDFDRLSWQHGSGSSQHGPIMVCRPAVDRSTTRRPAPHDAL